MRYTLLTLAILATFPAMANTQPVITQDQIKVKDWLVDKGIRVTNIVYDGKCFLFQAENSKGGRVCGDKVKFY